LVKVADFVPCSGNFFHSKILINKTSLFSLHLKIFSELYQSMKFESLNTFAQFLPEMNVAAECKDMMTMSHSMELGRSGRDTK
jgi:hypothetical protein